MRLKIISSPIGVIDGLSQEDFLVGDVYELSSEAARVGLAEGWAEVAQENAGARTERPSRAETCRVRCVLVVEDDPDLRRLTASVLRERGYQVRVACDGSEALQQAHQECPDLILLDLQMPVMDGWTFRVQQRYFAEKKLADVPVLLMTAADDAVMQAVALRAVGVVKKPFEPEHLVDAVVAAIGC